ncbi:GNAT family N-acetyltransferase [Kingella potus]|uniref:GNAT family N-acetyltransferase n=1 Tax=Kingella potus TaxID=265175 RepID=UPI001FD16C88|nr:GNAT family N-acetyltransferase [Kingella potus]UOP01216.1 GNAT family N-acetyltransferase [Kingella potus]
MLRGLHGIPVGFSFTANLLPQSPVAPWLDRFREDGHSRLLVCQYLQQQPAAFFSSLRQAAQEKNVVLYAPQSLNAHEDALLRGLAEQCGALAVRTPGELQAAVRAAFLLRRQGQGGIHILADGETGWLADMAEAAGVRAHVLPALSRRANPLEIRDAAAAALADGNCRALLVRAHDADTAAQLAQLQQGSETPLYAVLPQDTGADGAFSDGLSAFRSEEQAVQTLAAQAAWQRLHKSRQTPAKPRRPSCLPPDLRQAALLAEHPEELAAVLHLPPYGVDGFSDGLLSYTVLPHEGAVLEAQYCGQTLLLLPPFDTRHALRLSRFFGNGGLRPAFEQLLLSLHAAAYGFPQLQSLRIRADTQNALLYSENLSAAADAPPSEPLFAAAPLSDCRFFAAANGEILHIRPLLPEDAEALQRFVRSMDEADRKTRFMSAVKELPPARLARFTLIDYARDYALAAWRGSGEIAAWAQYASLRFPDACEFGIAVAADMKGQGLAACLMRQLIRRAGRQGYGTVCAEILSENTAMTALAAKLGFKISPSPDDARLLAARLVLQREKHRKNRLPGNKRLRAAGKTV